MGTIAPSIQSLIGRAASAYSAGPSIQHARVVCDQVARERLTTAVCYWNRSEDTAAFVAESYIGLLRLIGNLSTDSYLSIKAPAFGFDSILLEKIIEWARPSKTTLHFDAMAPDTVDATFKLIHEARTIYSHIGCTLPGRWARSIRDVDRAVDLGLRVRVVKGEWCGSNGDETDRFEGFMHVVERLAARRARHVAIATHDVRLASTCLDCLKSAGISCELELLYGLPRRKMLKVASARRIPTRLYVPYGWAGLPYRLKDAFRNPRIVTWFAHDLIRGSAAL